MANISNLEQGMHFWLQRRRIETRMPLLGNNMIAGIKHNVCSRDIDIHASYV
jgi:hypothetical protein